VHAPGFAPTKFRSFTVCDPETPHLQHHLPCPLIPSKRPCLFFKSCVSHASAENPRIDSDQEVWYAPEWGVKFLDLRLFLWMPNVLEITCFKHNKKGSSESGRKLSDGSPHIWTHPNLQECKDRLSTQNSSNYSGTNAGMIFWACTYVWLNSSEDAVH